MRDEQIVVAIFLGAGVIAGIISNYLNSFLAISVAIVLYVFFATLTFKRIERRKLVNQNCIIFALIWALVWITLNSM